MKLKKMSALLLAATMAMSLTACGGGGEQSSSGGNADSSGSNEVIKLTLWGAEEDQNFLKERVEAFKEVYSDQSFDIQIGVESESTAKDTVLTDIEAAADVYTFADDQLADLVDAGALLKLDDNMSSVLETYAGKSLDDVKQANVPVSIEAASDGDDLYAFPISADNGYFLYYDSSVISAEDTKSWDTLLAAAEKNGGGRKVGYVLASGWYNAGFFYGAGFTTERNDDGTTVCNWNGTADVSGVEVTKAMLNIAANPVFMAIADGDTANQIASGKLCAIVSGTWDAVAVKNAFGDGYAATKLPTYKAGGKDIQTGSVGGSKLMGVNSHCENSGWAVLLADYLTNEESQNIRYTQRGTGPSNVNAQQSDAVASDIAIAAVLEQSKFAVVQQVGGKYWDPAKSFGEMIAQGQIPADDDAKIQSALDTLVEGITAPIS